MTRVLILAGMCAAAAVGGAAGVQAQTPAAQPQTPAAQPPQAPAPPPVAPRRPYRGVFAGSDASARRDGLMARFTLAGGYDDNVVADEQGSVGAGEAVGGTFGAATAELLFSDVRGRLTYGLQGTSELRQYDATSSWRQTNHSAAASMSARLGRRGALSVRQAVRYSPFYQFEPVTALPGRDVPEIRETDTGVTDQNVAAMRSQFYDTEVTASQGLGRGSVAYRYGFRTSRFADDLLESSGHSAGAGYTRRVGRYATLRLGYGYQTVSYAARQDDGVTLHDLDLGGSYARPLSFSRRTTVGFSGGTAMVNSRGSRRYRVMADATAHHEIGRTWLLRGAYQQGVQVVSLFPEPLFGYTARGTLGGLVSRTLDVQLDAGYSAGSYDSARESNGYASLHGSARLRRAFGRSLAGYAEYSFYKYAVDDPLVVGQLTAGDFQRHGVRVGLTLWVPVFSERQTDAAR